MCNGYPLELQYIGLHVFPLTTPGSLHMIGMNGPICTMCTIEMDGPHVYPLELQYIGWFDHIYYTYFVLPHLLHAIPAILVYPVSSKNLGMYTEGFMRSGA